ncbi:MAG TPA: hypothetical protein VII22_23305, partial [Streptosporangiaceae bacterium]
FREGARRARSIIQTKHRRLQLTLDALGPEPLTVDQLTHAVYGKAVRPFQIRMAMAEMLGQLAYLHKRGWVERVTLPNATTAFRRAKPGGSGGFPQGVPDRSGDGVVSSSCR